MDREISPEIKRRRRRRQIITAAVAACAVVLISALLLALLSAKVNEKELQFSTVTRGTLETSVTTEGHVVAAYEEILVSPVATRIEEVYVQEGDSVAAGQPIMRLDLADTRADFERASDEALMKEYEISQADLSSRTHLTNLEMQISTKEMAVDRLKANLDAERRLDSIGTGTGERVREADLAWRTGRLELEQLRKQLANERRSSAAASRSKQLEGDIARRNLAQARRTLDNARLEAPRAGTLTFLNSSVGAQVGSGERLAVLADLSHFKVQGEMAEGHGDKIVAGAPVKVRISGRDFSGRIANLGATSKNGVIAFTVTLDKDSGDGLRAGHNARISVIYDVRPESLLIARGSYYNGPGEYILYVRTSDSSIQQRKVNLGDSNADFVEVKHGLEEGEQVVVSNTDALNHRKKIKLKSRT